MTSVEWRTSGFGSGETGASLCLAMAKTAD